MRRSAGNRKVLLDILRAANDAVEPAQIATLASALAAAWIPAPAWAVVTADLSGQVSVLAERAMAPDMAPALPAIASWVVQEGTLFASRHVGRDPRVASTFGGSVLALPLVHRERCFGALMGLDPKPSARHPRPSPATSAALRVLLEPISGALDKALLLKRVLALSVTDDLTRLYNSRYLNQVLVRETKRAARSRRPLSLLFIDLDGFKVINDTYGHLAGSRALVEAATLIRGSARETDIAARFGGDEFALVLPDTGGQGARAVADRVRERIAAHEFLVELGRAVRLTASVGVATLPDAALSPEGLVQAADRAMYHVKDRGKNGIQSAPAQTDA